MLKSGLNNRARYREGYCYAGVIEMTATEVWAKCTPRGRSKNRALPTPVTISMWGFSDEAKMYYSLSNNKVDQLVQMLSDPHFKKVSADWS